MKKYLQCLVFAAIAATILALPATAAPKAQVASGNPKKAIEGTQTAIAEIPKPPDPTAVIEPQPAQPIEPTPTPTPQAPTGDHEQLLADAGVPADQWLAADKIIQLESSWRTTAVEPTTGACGLAQELPCGKSGCVPSDTVCTLKWANTYVVSRYGSWVAALSFHYTNNWY